MSTALEKEALDRFGELLIRKVRGKAIADWSKLLDGRMKGETAARLGPAIALLAPSERHLLGRLVPEIVDSTLHHLLWSLDQDTSVSVAVKTSEGTVGSVREASDGLAGELYEWIPRFSDPQS